jgi:hypothetical protein
VSASGTGTSFRARLALGALALSGVLLGACGPDFDHIEMTTRPTRLGGRLDLQRVEVPIGGILKAHILPLNDDREVLEPDVRSLDPSVVEVARVASELDFAFLGVRKGTTRVEIRAAGDVVLILDAVVTDQPSAF